MKWIFPAVLSLAGLAALGTIGFGGYHLYALSDELTRTKLELASTTAAADKLAADKSALQDALTAEQKKNGSFEDQILGIAGTVGTLKKIAETDPELLAKYSKVYFLNENYIPPSLSDIDPSYLSDKTRKIQFRTEALPDLEKMIDDAKDDDVNLSVASAYRSFGAQAALKSSYKVTYGSGANSFSADQGYSEHQLGTAVDLTTASIGGTLTGFEKTSAYTWLVDNAWKYGFILSYPKKNTYYVYEPWHWRFVGRDLAERLHDEDKYFYELDQRTIDTYLASFFD